MLLLSPWQALAVHLECAGPGEGAAKAREEAGEIIAEEARSIVADIITLGTFRSLVRDLLGDPDAESGDRLEYDLGRAGYRYAFRFVDDKLRDSGFGRVGPSPH